MSKNIIDMNNAMNILNINEHLNKKISKNELIDDYIYKLMMPYIVYLKFLLSNKNVYKKIKKNISNHDLNKIDLYFLMEVIKKQIECIQ